MPLVDIFAEVKSFSRFTAPHPIHKRATEMTVYELRSLDPTAKMRTLAIPSEGHRRLISGQVLRITVDVVTEEELQEASR